MYQHNDPILGGLNEMQRLAVETTEGAVRVIAGAGSGKTRALTHRYAYLVEYLGIEPSNLLCVTFTNKSAQEMRRRVKKLIGGERDTGYISTYHGFCVRVLREDIHHLFYPKNFLILDTEDQKTILREIYEELGLKVNDRSFNTVLKKIGEMKADEQYVYELIDRERAVDVSGINDEERKIIKLYLKKQRRVYGLDFDDLINFTFVLFKEYEKVLAKWQERLHYIQVDEFQDSNGKQFQLVKMLSNYHGNLFVVGDPDQTIYEWRGADPKYIVQFDQWFPNSQTIFLNQNYRSTPEILSVGNDLIQHNKMRVEKSMFTENSGGLKAIHYHAKNEQDEAKWITTQMNTLRTRGARLQDIAVLYRSNYQSRFIEQQLIHENMDYVIYGGFKFFERKEIKDALAHLRMITFGDDLSFARIVNEPRRQMGKKRMEFLREMAERDDQTLYETLQTYIHHEKLARTKAVEFIEAIEEVKTKKDELSVSDLLQEVLDATGYETYIREDGDQERLDNLMELKHSVVQYEQSYGEKITLEYYLQMITLYTENDREDQKDSVKLMTVHTAKGLEYPYVFLVGMTEGVFPNERSLRDRKEYALEEERRLAYVAMTRAEKELYITESEGYIGRGQKKYPSRFLFEINEELYRRIGDLEEELIAEAKEVIRMSKQIDGPQSSGAAYAVGDKVRHPVFGEGEIKRLDTKKRLYEVYFPAREITRPISWSFKGLVKP
ncbi:helicase UvrD [Pontibacillus halophilus JSM 076056 = DSM 19796]|uniref:DNA 3'-5' helicase n=1 Tax=Pontibacillus halophilus JSM 076056 = DSM 19796 TaxID=1385510 RepID=A0A0A5GRX0_9BACI|nr:UvrD-helicase domain-containing protein [Pontibacillus halophilus]KGX93983.1 helicase UvrD [Pontibacillus halophilus JSM 076056 = DSM 19796]